MQPNRLPIEIIQAILDLVPKDSLAPASLVSKAWRSLILPRLYESILLYGFWSEDQNRFIGQDELAKRILDEPKGKENEHVVQLSSYVKRIRTDLTLGGELFLPAVMRMKNLEHIDWDISFPEFEGGAGWYTTLVALYRELPKLRSLALTMGQQGIPLGELDKVVPFTNLRELSIEFDSLLEGCDDLEEELVPGTLIEFIRGAHDIESLRLAFVEHEEIGLWGPSEMFSALRSDHFPNLRKFEVWSQYLALDNNFSDPHTRQFIQDPGQLRKIAFLADGYDETPNFLNFPPLIVTPTDLEEMMPSIRHFEGPGLPVKALLKSKLAEQIEILVLHEPVFNELGDLSVLLPELDSPGSPELSSLKGLGYFMNGSGSANDRENIINALSKLAIRMPVLQELILCPSEEFRPEELDQLLPIIEQLPHLRRLVIRPQVSGTGTGKINQNNNIRRFYKRAKVLCPLLDTKDASNVAFSLAP